MAPCKRQVKAKRHLVCDDCHSWVDFALSGCTKSWTETKEEGFTFQCVGCWKVKGLEKEVARLVDIVKGMEMRISKETDGMERDDRERVGNTVRLKEQSSGNKSSGNKTEERRLRGGKVIGGEENGRSTAGNVTGVKVTGEKVTVEKEVGGKKRRERREGNAMGGKMTGRKEVRVHVTEEKSGGMMTGGKVTRETASRKNGTDKIVTGEQKTGEQDYNQTDGNRRKSYSEAVIEGAMRKERVFMGDSIMRKTDKTLSEGEDVVVCLPGAKIEHVTERVEKVLGHGKGGSILVHVGTNNADREGTSGIVQKYRQLVKKLKKTRVEQIILSGILPVMGGRGPTYRNCKRMAINALVEQMCKEEGVGFVDLWGYFVGREDMYMRDGLHLSGKGAAIFSEKLLQSVDSGAGCIYLN